MNMHTTKPVTPPLPERIRIVKAFRASGMKMSEYARLHEIAVATLGYWNKEYTKTWRKAEEAAEEWQVDRHERDIAIGKRLKTIELQAERPAEPDWRKLYEDEKHKVEALQKVIAVLGFQL